MWTEIKRTSNLMTAEMWKELFEGEGVPTRILPSADKNVIQETGVFRILIPEDKGHIIEEVLRKL